MAGLIWKPLRRFWGKTGSNALPQGVVDVGLWSWGGSFVSAAAAATLAWIGDRSAVIVYLAALDAFAVTLLAINGVQEIRRRRQQKRTGEHFLPSPYVSSHEEATREKITVLFHSYGQPTYTDLQQLTDRLSARLNWSQNPRDVMIATLAGHLVFAPCYHAARAMGKALQGADTHNIDVLQHRLREFVNAYRRHVRWMHHVALFSSPPLSEDHGYRRWQEKHKLFRQELQIVAATDDFSQLRKEIAGDWQDTVESAERQKSSY